MSPFTRRVLAVVSRIPPGRVATYGDVAAAAGFDGAARAVGTVMRTCNRPDLPCHRVVAAGGQLGGYGGQLALKQALLRQEGIAFSGRRIRDFATRRWTAEQRARGRRDEDKGIRERATQGRGEAEPPPRIPAFPRPRIPGRR